MGFAEERDTEWTEEEKQKVRDIIQLVEPKKLGGIGSWLIDRERNLIFLCFSVGAPPKGLRGKYVLCIDDIPVVTILDKFSGSIGEGMRQIRFVIRCVQIPDELIPQRPQVIEYLREAFEAEGHTYSRVVKVEVEFQQGVGHE
jgi:hypothetical protein